MISKSISTSRKVNRLTDRAALLYTWLIPHTDDYGHLEGDAFSIKAKIFPMRKIKESEIEKDLALIEKNGLIFRYEIGQEQYIEIVGFDNFQVFRTDRVRVKLHPFPKGFQTATSGIPMGEIVSLSEVKLSQVKLSEAFVIFWESYPKKVAKRKAELAFKKIKASEYPKIFEALEKHKKTDQWTKDDGKFIPHPTTWLNQERWNDQLEVKKGESKFDGVQVTKA